MANQGIPAGHKDGFRAGSQGSSGLTKVFGGSGKSHDGGMKATPSGGGVLNGSGDRDQLSSPKTPASNMKTASYKSGYGMPSAKQRREGG